MENKQQQMDDYLGKDLFDSKKPFRTLYNLLGMTIPEFILCNSLLFIKSIPIFFAPHFIAQIIKMASNPYDYSDTYFIMTCIIFMVVLILNVPAHYVFIGLIAKHIRLMEYRLRSSLVYRLQELSISFHDNSEKGQLQSKILRDVENLVLLANLFFQMGIGAIFALVISFFTCFTNNYKVGVFFLIVGPISAWIIQKFRKQIKDLNTGYRKEIERMSARMTDMLNLVTVTRAHGAEELETEYLNRRFNQVREKGVNLDKGNGFFSAIVFVIMHLVLFSVISIIGWFTFKGNMTVDKIALYYGLFSLIIGSFQQCLGMFPLFSKGFDSMNSIAEVLESSDLEYNNNKIITQDVKGNIVFDKVSYNYDDTNKLVVKDFSLNVKKGECIAFIGESGSGKSTLMNMVIGFLRPKSGKILLDNIDMDLIDMRTFRRFIAVVPQTTSLLTGTIYDNIIYGNKDYSRSAVESAAKAASLHDFIITLPNGYNTMIGENGTKLSGGQRQRIAIARAIIRRPKLIILDEATAALDTISEKNVQDAINQLIEGRTTFIVAHRLSTIRHADKIIVMKEGVCVEEGTHEELEHKKGEFYKLKNTIKE